MKWRFLLHPQSVSQNLHTALTTEIVVHTDKSTGDFYNILRCQLSTVKSVGRNMTKISHLKCLRFIYIYIYIYITYA